MTGSFLDNLTGAYSGLRRSVIDPETGRALVTSEPTGRIVERAPVAPVGIDDSGRMVSAVPGFIADAPQAIASAVTLPRDAWRGEVETMPTRMSREEGQRVADLAGLVMTGSMPFRAPKGALRMFGGAAKEADDPFAALEAALAQSTKNAEPALPLGPTRIDPNSKSWDLYHGSGAGPDFKRFDPHRGEAHSESGALFLAPEGDTASMYAGSGTGPSGAEAGPRVFRTTVDPGRTKVFDLRDLAEEPAFRDRARRVYLDEMGTKLSLPEVRGLDEIRNAYEQNLLDGFQRDRDIAAQLAEMGLPPGERTGVSFGYGHIGAALQQAREEGLDTAILRGLAEHGGEDQVAVLTPGRVRSRYSGDLLYSTAPVAVGAGAAAAGLLAGSREAKASPANERKPMPGLFDDLMPQGQPGARTEAAPKAKAGGLFDDLVPPAAPVAMAPNADAAGDAAAAVGRGMINGVPVIGPYLLAGVNRAAAGVRSLQNDTTFSDELRNVEAFGEATAKENPGSTIGGELAGGVLGTAPLVAAAPAAFGAGAASLPVRMAVSGGSGAVLGTADSAVRSGGDVTATAVGGGLGLGLGAAAPAIGAGVGRAIGAFTSRGRSNGVMQEALEGISDKDLASAKHLIEQSRNLPGGGVALTLDEALNAVTGGQATRASQLARVVGNSGGEGGRIMGEFYAARPASVDNVGRAGFERVAPINHSPTGLGFDLQDAARAGLAQTPEGQALASARRAQAERITPEQAGRAMQEDLGGVRDLRDAARSSRANVDYRLAREAPETVGIERTVTVERPGDPVVTQPEGAPRFTEAAPRPLDPAPTVEASAVAAPESLARFVARHGGIRLDGDAAATDLHRFRIPGLGSVAREGGKGIDNFWRERLIESGYFWPDADGGAARDITNDLLRKLQNEQRGVPSYPVDAERAAAAARGQQGRVTDEYRAALSEMESRLDEALSRSGVPPEGLHPEIRSRTLGAMLRGENTDPLDAYERTIAGMVDPPAPYSRGTTVTEEIPDVRFGQVDPRPAMAAIAEQGRFAKGDVRGALGSTGRDLREPGGDLDLSVAGNLKARERLDMRIKRAEEFSDGTKVRDLTITRNALDGALKRVPEVATADANFVRNSVPLAPFERPNAPLNRATAREDVPGAAPGPFRTPAEQVPEIFSGPTALREALTNGGAATRQAAEGSFSTRILDAATDARGDVSAESLRKAMRENADALDQLPALRDRLSSLVVAREGMVRIQASPLGRIAESPNVKNAIAALFPADPLANSQDEIRSAVQALARNNPGAARDLTRIYMETVFNEATQQAKGVAKQYGGAGFASAIRGNGQQRHNLEAAVRALPEGDTLWAGLDRMLTTLEATGYRPQKGSDTAFNQAIQARLKEGAGTVGQAVNDVVAGAAVGATVGGAKGALGGALVGGRRGGAKVIQERRVQKDSEAIARILTDPRAASMLRSLAREKPGSRGAEILTTKLLQIGGRGVGSGDQSSKPSR